MAHYFEEQTDIKLIILFIVENFKSPVTNQQIVEVALTKNILNYFDLKQYLQELVESDLLDAYADNEKTLYQMTQKGTETLSFFQEKIPYSVREHLLTSIRDLRRKEQMEKDITAEYEKVNDLDYTVRLCINECGYPLLSMSLSVPSEELASRMCLNFRKNPQEFYQKTFGLLSEE